MTWGWTPDAVGTTATTVGVLVALYGAWQANRVARRALTTADQERDDRVADQIRRQDDQRAEARRSPAELVAAWTTAESSVRADDGRPRIYYTLNVSNRSDLPVTGVRVLLAPSQGEVEQLVLVSEFAVGPGEKLQRPVALYGTAEIARVRAVWSMYFTDAAGRRWHRRSDVLREPTEDEEKADIPPDVSGFDLDGEQRGNFPGSLRPSMSEVDGTRIIGQNKRLSVRMNADLLMGEDLKKTGAGNLFTIFGEPDIEVRDAGERQHVVELLGVDVYDPTTGTVRSGGTDKVALWMVDTAYDGESFFVRHCYFTGGNNPPKRLKTALKADIDDDDVMKVFPVGG